MATPMPARPRTRVIILSEFRADWLADAEIQGPDSVARREDVRFAESGHHMS